MILRNVTLRPFGGLTDLHMGFERGLNVITGRNEAGKTTLFSAIQKVLFTRTNLNKREYEKEIKSFIPIGGDTSHVELEFEAGGSICSIKRTWGATKGSVLVVDNGAAVTDEDSIARMLAGLLPAKEGTFKSVLMTYQSGLSKTIENLKDSYHDTLNSLGDVLRRAVLETDGVSVDLFMERINEKHRLYFSHWDPELNMPEKNRGIGNKWTREVGSILTAYYEKEELGAELERTRSYEKEIDGSNSQLNRIETLIKEKEIFLEKYSPVVDSIQQRKVLEAGLKAAELELDKYTEVNSSWPVIENEITKLEAQLGPKEVELPKLLDEKSTAENAEKNRKKFEQLEKALKKKAVLEDAIAGLEKEKKITSGDLDALRKALARIENLKTRLLAGKLSLGFSTDSEMKITVHKDLDEPVVETIEKDKPLTVEAEGRIRLEHYKWTMKVTSGETDFEESEREIHQATKERDRLFRLFGVRSLKEAEELSQRYQEKLAEVERAQKNLDDELDGTGIEELERSVGETGVLKETGPLHEIVEKIAYLDNEISGIKKDLESYGKKISEYESEYGDKKKLLLLVAGTVSKKESIENDLDRLGNLPEEIDDPDSLVSKYNQEKNKFEELKDEKDEIYIKLMELANRTPETTSEEIERQLTDAEERFSREMNRGNAVARIRKTAVELLISLDTDTFSGLKKDLEACVGKLTGGRYKQLSMDQSELSLPGGFVRQDGEIIPYYLLSYGTKDALGLSLRLVMGRFFLKDSEGVYIMDDPFVDMDPERQKAGAEMLREFAEKTQLIIFTCHPSHAELIGGHRRNFG
jgi:exonuclease SbcC